MKALFCTILAFTTFARAAEMDPPPAEPSRTRRVHLLSDDERVELHRLPRGRAEVFVCKTPCGGTVQFHSSDWFVLSGPGIRDSTWFAIKPREEDLTLHVSAGSTGTLVLGGVLLGAGSLITPPVGIVYAVTEAFGDVFCDQDPRCIASNANRRNMLRGVTLTGVALALAGGAILLFAAHPTRFTAEP